MRKPVIIAVALALVGVGVALWLTLGGKGRSGGAPLADLERLPADADLLFAADLSDVVTDEAAAALAPVIAQAASRSSWLPAGLKPSDFRSAAGAVWRRPEGGQDVGVLVRLGGETAQALGDCPPKLTRDTWEGHMRCASPETVLIRVAEDAWVFGTPGGATRLADAIDGRAPSNSGPLSDWMKKVDRSASIVLAQRVPLPPFEGYAAAIGLRGELATEAFVPGDDQVFQKIKAQLGMAKLALAASVEKGLGAEAGAGKDPQLQEATDLVLKATRELADSVVAEEVDGGVLVKARSDVDGARVLYGLAAVSASVFTRYLQKAKEATEKVAIQRVQSAIQLYEVQHGKLPDDLQVLAEEKLLFSDDDLRDSYGQPLFVDKPAADGRPRVCSGGPDKVRGTDDDICGREL